MNKILLVSLIFIFAFACAAAADSASSIKKGKAAFMEGNYKEALKYYREAFLENPDSKTGAMIVRLEEMLGIKGTAKTAAEPMPTAVPTVQTYSAPEKAPVYTAPGKAPAYAAPAENEEVNAGSVLMGIADFLSVGVMAYAYIDYNNTADKYYDLLAVLDNTGYSNYVRLKAEYDTVQAKQAFLITTACIAGAALIYTYADVFWLHAAFPVKIALNCDKNGMRFAACFREEF